MFALADNLNDNSLLLCLQLLNEEEFKTMDKIKTMGSCYMAAVGLTPDSPIQVRSFVPINPAILSMYSFIPVNSLSIIEVRC